MKMLRTVLLAGVVVVGGYFAWQATHRPAPPPPAAPPTPVAAATAKDGDVPIMLTAIGNVRALNQVDIRPQVGGVLLQVPVQEGDLVRQGQVLAIIDPRPLQAALDKAKAQMTQDQAQLENAQLDRQRYATLASHDFASRQQLDTQVATVARLQGTVQADQASINDAQLNLDYAVLRSPIDGRVGIRRVDPGNLLAANQAAPIFTLVQEQPTSVIFTLPQTELPQVQAAQAKSPARVLARVTGAPKDSEGVLITIDNQVDVASGTVQLRAKFQNEDDALTAGQYVNVQVQVGVAHGVVIPHVAVQHSTQGLFVYVVQPDKTIARRNVELAYDAASQSVVRSGLDDGMQVVTEGQSRIGDGARVTINDGGQGAVQQSAQR